MRTYNIRILILSVLFIIFSCQKEELIFEDEIVIEDISQPTVFEGGEYLTVPEYLSTPISGSELVIPTIIINYIPSNDGTTITDEFAELEAVRDWGG